MYLIPLNQLESVELVIHGLKMAGGEADCSTCPVRKVCMKQCLTIASAVENMLQTNALPNLERPQPEPQLAPEQEPDDDPPRGRPKLTLVK